MQGHCQAAGRRIVRQSNDRHTASQETCLGLDFHYNRAG
ncbi:hypothetical protein C4K13_3989 [Pseudomonas chlororaphis subsp. aureofaciens]|nr:hypothetical protein C4K14_4232 [Pseudomonas chlororaphis subsp. aureofaciens]AZD93403.1 hypothetical protein C4K13_3989 [Pseudomonas chlororaphis subsp. aureofaciens]